MLDAVCLAVTARFKAEGKCECIHGDVKPGDEGLLVDGKGLKMQMVVPVRGVFENIQKNKLLALQFENINKELNIGIGDVII